MRGMIKHCLFFWHYFKASVLNCFLNWHNIYQRTGREEYWCWFLFICLCDITIISLSFFVDYFFKNILYSVSLCFKGIILIPSITISIRRLHDINRSGWWLLITFIPFGLFVILYWKLLLGDKKPNQYGPVPKEPFIQ